MVGVGARMAVCAMDWKRFWWALIALESECEAARVGSGCVSGKQLVAFLNMWVTNLLPVTSCFLNQYTAMEPTLLTHEF